MLPRGAPDDVYLMPARDRARIFLQGLLKFMALVLVAGGVGVALGMGLSQLSGENDPAAIEAGTDAQPAATISTATAVAPSAAATTTTTPPDPLAAIRVTVVDARLFTDGTPSGVEEQRGRMTVRTRVQNTGEEPVTLEPPTLRVGKVRIPADPAGAQFAVLEPGTSQTVTLRFALAAEATPKVVRDRRARILLAGQSVAMRVKVRRPVA